MNLFFNNQKIGTFDTINTCLNKHGPDYEFYDISKEVIFGFYDFDHIIKSTLKNSIKTIFNLDEIPSDYCLDLKRFFEFYGYETNVENSTVNLYSNILNRYGKIIDYKKYGRIFFDGIFGIRFYESEGFYSYSGYYVTEDCFCIDYNDKYTPEINLIIHFMAILYSLCDFKGKCSYILKIEKLSLIKNANY